MPNQSQNDYTIAAVLKALKILRLFDYESRHMTLTEISAKSDIGKSGVLRILASLEQGQFVKYDEQTKKYKLGVAIYKLGQTAFDFLDVRDVARPILKAFAAETKLHVHLAVLEDEKVIVIDRIYPFENRGMLSLVSEVGGDVPIHCTGVGKVLTAFSPVEVQERLIRNCDFCSHSQDTITDPEAYRALMSQVREQGYAMNWGENEPFITCTTFPIYNLRHEVVAAASGTGLCQTMTGDFLVEVREKLKHACRSISQELGDF